MSERPTINTLVLALPQMPIERFEKVRETLVERWLSVKYGSGLNIKLESLSWRANPNKTLKMDAYSF